MIVLVERLAGRDPGQAEVFEQWLSRLVDAYGDRIVPITVHVAEDWGRLNVPDPLLFADDLMAATALVHDWTLVTRHAGDAQGIAPSNKCAAPVYRSVLMIISCSGGVQTTRRPQPEFSSSAA